MLGLLLLCLIVAAALLIRSPRVHAYLLRTVQEKATAALNTPVQFRDYSIHLSGLSPSVDVYQVTVQGASNNPPLAQADQLHLQVTIASLLRRSWYVNDIRIVHPVVHIFVDSQGEPNLPPSPAPSNQKSQTNLFDLGVRHFLLERGELYYNDRKSDLSADLQQLLLQSRFDVTGRRYYGTLSYRNGHVRLSGANPLPHSLDATFSATPQEFALEKTQFRAGNSRLTLSASLTDYTNPKMHGQYQGVLDAGELRRTLRNTNLPEGKLLLNGNFSYASEGNRPMLEVAALNGEASSEILTFVNGNVRLSAHNLEAKYSLAHGNATVTGLHLDLLGGKLTGTASMRDLAGATKSQLSASLNHISLAQLQRAFVPATTSQAGIQGAVNATATANWRKSMQDLTARADASLESDVQAAHGGASTPVNGVIHAIYRGRTQELAIEKSFLRAPRTSLTMNGTVSKNSALQLEMRTDQLHNLEDLAMAFRPPDAAPLGLYGRAVFDGEGARLDQ